MTRAPAEPAWRLGMARHGHPEKATLAHTVVEQEDGCRSYPEAPRRPGLCSLSRVPDLPMKVVQESGAAQMLLLITETSQSNSLLVCVWGFG